MQDRKAHGRVGRRCMPPAYNSDLVTKSGKMDGETIEVAFCTASGSVAHMYQSDSHIPTPIARFQPLPKAGEERSET
jgi:hypothetical protein